MLISNTGSALKRAAVLQFLRVRQEPAKIDADRCSLTSLTLNSATCCHSIVKYTHHFTIESFIQGCLPEPWHFTQSRGWSRSRQKQDSSFSETECIELEQGANTFPRSWSWGQGHRDILHGVGVGVGGVIRPWGRGLSRSSQKFPPSYP